MSRHGIFIKEESTALTVPITGYSAVQVVVGTAPVNMLADPAGAVNTPIMAAKAAEAMEKLGYCTDFSRYTLCQTMYVTSSIYQVAPVVYINVLDPQKHKKALEAVEVPVDALRAVVEMTGILKEGLTVTAGEAELELSKDYTLSYDIGGYLVINLVAGGAGTGAEKLSVAGNVLDPDAVTKEDIIGAYDPETGKETGMELIRQVYPRFGIVPSLALAPGYSQVPEVGIALSAKMASINGVFKGIALLDLDTEKARKYADCKAVKEDSGFTSEFCYPLWPCFQVGELILAASAVVGALISHEDASNDDVPYIYPSNKIMSITGTCLADGTEIIMDQDQAGAVNEFGVTTAFNSNGWRLWGNYTGAYPAVLDAKDMWIATRRMFNWQGNTFIQTYLSKVDDPMNRYLIESIVDSENIRCSAFAPDKWAGARIEYAAEDNPDTDILAGKMTFRQHIAPYTPAQEIVNILDYDVSMLRAALTGEGGE
ncbi:MAG: phage tail sheath family protein [Lachnospiraceae bacterium]|nr:phage tail sheath family protein [Lachnospiraceae bacterium]